MSIEEILELKEKMGSKLVGGGVVLLPSVMVLFCTFVSVPLSVKVP